MGNRSDPGKPGRLSAKGAAMFSLFLRTRTGRRILTDWDFFVDPDGARTGAAPKRLVLKGTAGVGSRGVPGWRAMLVHRVPLLLLGAVLRSFLPGGHCDSASHSLSYFYLQLPEPSQGLPQSFIRSYLDDQPIARYDSLTGMEPLVPWMEEEGEKWAFLSPEWVFRSELKLSKRDQAEGLHTWQVVLGCELWEDGSKGWFFHYGYDGMDFISFDKVTQRWVTAQHQAQKVKEKWEDDPGWSERNKFFLEETCIEELQRYQFFKNRTPQRTEPPVGKVTRKVVDDSLEVLICQAFGFYPKEIQATWMRDEEICQYETLYRNVAPNSDGTYYVLLSIEIDPKERDRFWCLLNHEGLQEPLVLAWEEETATGWWIPVTGGLISGAVIFLICKYRRGCNQKAKSSPEDSPPEILCLPTISGREEDERLLNSSLQSEITLDDRASYGGWSSQRAVEDSGSTLRRREGKQLLLRRSKSCSGKLEALGKAGATESEENWLLGLKAEKVAMRPFQTRTLP